MALMLSFRNLAVAFGAWVNHVTYYLVFFIDLATRRIEVAAVTDSSNEKLMLQVGREL